MIARSASLRSGVGVAAVLWASWPGLVLADVPLIVAVEHNDTAAVRVMLDEGADVDGALPDGSTALHAAALGDRLQIARLLLDAGAEATAATRYKVTPLALAAANGSTAMIGLLLDAGADPNETSREGQTALMSAAINGATDSIAMLIERGADVGSREPFRGQTALMWAATHGNAEAIAALAAAGGDIAARSSGGFTALLLAARENRTEAVEKLLELGADVEDTAPDGTSALNIAAVNAYFDLASLLLDAGADPNAPDPRGSALHTVAWLHKPGATWDAIRSYTLPATAPRPTGRVTPLQLARKLLDHGADPNTRAAFSEQRFDKVSGQALNPPSMMLGRHYLTYNGGDAFLRRRAQRRLSARGASGRVWR